MATRVQLALGRLSKGELIKLVLSRKVGQKVIVNDNICVTLVAVHGNQVRLGFSAPAAVTIRRQELDRMPRNARNKLRQSDSYAGITHSEGPS